MKQFVRDIIQEEGHVVGTFWIIVVVVGVIVVSPLYLIGKGLDWWSNSGSR